MDDVCNRRKVWECQATFFISRCDKEMANDELIRPKIKHDGWKAPGNFFLELYPFEKRLIDRLIGWGSNPRKQLLCEMDELWER